MESPPNRTRVSLQSLENFVLRQEWARGPSCSQVLLIPDHERKSPASVDRGTTKKAHPSAKIASRDHPFPLTQTRAYSPGICFYLLPLPDKFGPICGQIRSEEHTSELQSLRHL